MNPRLRPRVLKQHVLRHVLGHLRTICADIRSEGCQTAASRSESDISIDSDASGERQVSQWGDELPSMIACPVLVILTFRRSPQLTTICEMNKVADLFVTCACPGCGHAALRMTCDEGMNNGLALCMQVACSNCHEVVGKKKAEMCHTIRPCTWLQLYRRNMFFLD